MYIPSCLIANTSEFLGRSALNDSCTSQDSQLQNSSYSFGCYKTHSLISASGSSQLTSRHRKLELDKLSRISSALQWIYEMFLKFFQEKFRVHVKKEAISPKLQSLHAIFVCTLHTNLVELLSFIYMPSVLPTFPISSEKIRHAFRCEPPNFLSWDLQNQEMRVHHSLYNTVLDRSLVHFSNRLHACSAP